MITSVERRREKKLPYPSRVELRLLRRTPGIAVEETVWLEILYVETDIWLTLRKRTFQNI